MKLIMGVLIASWIATCAFAQAIAAPLSIDDLAAPEQATRDRAAKELRAAFKPIARDHWNPLLKLLKNGPTEPEVLEILKSFKIIATLRPPRLKDSWGAPMFNDGFGTVADYRLDAQWSLRAVYDTTTTKERLYETSLYRSIEYVWIDPPRSFTGAWVVYYKNGVAAFRIEYKDGRYNGTFTQYNDDGSRKHVQHYIQNHLDGKDEWY